MRFHEAIKLVVEDYGIKWVAVAQRSGVPATSLSSFINGNREFHTDNLEKILDALPLEARAKVFNLVLNSGTVRVRPTLSAIISELSPDSRRDRKEAAEAIREISKKFLENSGNVNIEDKLASVGK